MNGFSERWNGSIDGGPPAGDRDRDLGRLGHRIRSAAVLAGGCSRHSAQDGGIDHGAGVSAIGSRRPELDGATVSFKDSMAAPSNYPRSELTAREQQVLELVEQGCKNKEIAVELGIKAGHCGRFISNMPSQENGVRGRYGLALNGCGVDRGMVSLPA